MGLFYSKQVLKEAQQQFRSELWHHSWLTPSRALVTGEVPDLRQGLARKVSQLKPSSVGPLQNEHVGPSCRSP